jgi:hypothetical protein
MAPCCASMEREVDSGGMNGTNRGVAGFPARSPLWIAGSIRGVGPKVYASRGAKIKKTKGSQPLLH